jgi:hypothetical protein
MMLLINSFTDCALILVANYKGNLVPSVIMGGGGQAQGNGVNDLINLLQAKTARDLSLDMSLPKQQP